MGGGGLFLSNSVCRWDYRKMIVNEGGGGRGRLIRILQSLRRGVRENLIVTSNILGPSPTPQAIGNSQSFICGLKTQNVYQVYRVNDTRRKGIYVFI